MRKLSYLVGIVGLILGTILYNQNCGKDRSPGSQTTDLPELDYQTKRDLVGTLDVEVTDNFKTGVSKTRYSVTDEATGVTTTIYFPQGVIKRELITGQRVRAIGYAGKTQNLIGVLEDGVTQIEILEEPKKPSLVSGGVYEKLLVIPVRFKDTGFEYICSPSNLKNIIFGSIGTSLSVNKTYSSLSGDTINVQGKVIDPVTIQKNSVGYCYNNGDITDTWIKDAQKLIPSYVGQSNYNRKVYVFPTSVNCDYGGRTKVTQPGATSNLKILVNCDWQEGVYSVLSHELGHSTGFRHGAAPLEDGSIYNYGDGTDLMGGSWSVTTFNSVHMSKMWIPENKIQQVTSNATIKMAALELSTNHSYPRVLKIQIPGQSQNYFISYRKPIYGGVSNDTTGISGHVQIHDDRRGDGSGGEYDSVYRHFLSVGETFFENNISIRFVTSSSMTATLDIQFGGGGVIATPAPEVPTVELSGSPNPCVFANGAGSCTSTVSFAAGTGRMACVFVGSTPFACSGNGQGTGVASWIGGSPITFDLRDGSLPTSTILKSIQIKGVSGSGPTSSYLTATPNPCKIPAGQGTCTSTISFDSGTGRTACVFLGTKLFACGPSGSGKSDAWWIGRSAAVFDLRDGDQVTSKILKTLSVSGQ